MLFMEVCAKEGQKRGLAVLFHEKPFAGINGNGKHANWSVAVWEIRIVAARLRHC